MNLLGVQNKQYVALAWHLLMYKYTDDKFENIRTLVVFCMYIKSLLFVFILICWQALRRAWKNILTVLEFFVN